MNASLPAWLAPAWLMGVALSTVWAGRGMQAVPLTRVARAAQALVLAVAIVTPDGRVAYAALAVSGALLTWIASTDTRTGAAYLAASAVLAALTAVTITPMGIGSIAFVTSSLAIALRAGVFPLHAGAVALAESRSARQAEQLATLPFAVFVHLKFVAQSQLAHEAAPWLVVIGAGSALLFALVALVQRDLRRLYIASTLMHGGMLVAALGAAGRGHSAAALLVVVTMVLALAGFSTMLSAFEERVGTGEVPAFAGRARAFPRLAAALAFFGGAAVGLPGTAGFVADDLLLHALWGESVTAAVLMIVASALLAVATLALFARVFFGPPQRHLAPDLAPGDRRVAVVLVALLLILGFAPQLLVTPVNAVLR